MSVISNLAPLYFGVKDNMMDLILLCTTGMLNFVWVGVVRLVGRELLFKVASSYVSYDTEEGLPIKLNIFSSPEDVHKNEFKKYNFEVLKLISVYPFAY